MIIEILRNNSRNFQKYQIEGCMNSRPLVPLSADSGCYEAVTKAHFLIERPLVVRPIDEVPGTTPLRARWRELQAVLSAFWKRWSTEYLNSMQQRSQWRTALKNLKVDDIVVIQESTPPSAWRLGRVIGVCPGADGLVRVLQNLLFLFSTFSSKFLVIFSKFFEISPDNL